MGTQPQSNARALAYRLRHANKRQWVALTAMDLHRRLRPDRPMRLGTALLLAWLGGQSRTIDGLYAKDRPNTNRAETIQNRRLAAILGDRDRGEWALGVDAINYLQQDIELLRPRRILEFGSGISTLCLALFMAEVHGKVPCPRIFSIEQEERFARQTESLVRQHGYGEWVTVIHAPLTTQTVEGVTCVTYDLASVDGVFGSAEFEYCLIDGPNVQELGGRFATLPLVRQRFAPHARFVLDDALRSRELLVAKKWKSLPYIGIDGIVLTRKGLLIGFVN